jgi:hypothetical protein
MPKKEKSWTMGMPKGEHPPFEWQVWLKGTKKPIMMSAFDLQHIQDQCENKKVVMAKRLPEEKEETESMPMGPKGAEIHRPAEYDKGFKILRAWIDENGGPPEEIRVKLRELWIDYDKAPRKTTKYSARKKKRHKI